MLGLDRCRARAWFDTRAGLVKQCYSDIMH